MTTHNHFAKPKQHPQINNTQYKLNPLLNTPFIWTLQSLNLFILLHLEATEDKPRPKTDQENKLIQGIREGPLATGRGALKPASSRQRYQPTAHPTPLRRCVTVAESQTN
ncbi:hypothetical protein Bca4012_090388 [Brassica carinata]